MTYLNFNFLWKIKRKQKHEAHKSITSHGEREDERNARKRGNAEAVLH